MNNIVTLSSGEDKVHLAYKEGASYFTRKLRLPTSFLRAGKSDKTKEKSTWQETAI